MSLWPSKSQTGEEPILGNGSCYSLHLKGVMPHGYNSPGTWGIAARADVSVRRLLTFGFLRTFQAKSSEKGRCQRFAPLEFEVEW